MVYKKYVFFLYVLHIALCHGEALYTKPTSEVINPSQNLQTGNSLPTTLCQTFLNRTVNRFQGTDPVIIAPLENIKIFVNMMNSNLSSTKNPNPNLIQSFAQFRESIDNFQRYYILTLNEAIKSGDNNIQENAHKCIQDLHILTNKFSNKLLLHDYSAINTLLEAYQSELAKYKANQVQRLADLIFKKKLVNNK